MSRYMVQVDPQKTEQVKTALRGLGVTIVTQTFDYITIDIPEALVPKVRTIPGVVAVRPERPVGIATMPVDKKFQEWLKLFSNPFTFPMAAIYSIQADIEKKRWPTGESRKVLEAHIAEGEGITGKGVKVGVIDTGLDPLCVQVQGLTAKSTVEGEEFFPFDTNGHSTHCYSTIGGKSFKTPWGTIYGVAPDAELHIYKALGYMIGAGSTTSVIRAMADALADGCDIVSMSLGGPEEDPTVSPECRCAKALTDAGIIMVVAAGNDGPGPSTLGTPGNSPDVITVGAIDMEGNLADFSSRGPPKHWSGIKPDIVAPGVDILSSTTGLIEIMQSMALDGPRLGAISGTSMATPHVAGVVALGKEYFRKEYGVELTTNVVKNILEELGEHPKNNERGWGILTWSMIKEWGARHYSM